MKGKFRKSDEGRLGKVFSVRPNRFQDHNGLRSCRSSIIVSPGIQGSTQVILASLVASHELRLLLAELEVLVGWWGCGQIH